MSFLKENIEFLNLRFLAIVELWQLFRPPFPLFFAGSFVERIHKGKLQKMSSTQVGLQCALQNKLCKTVEELSTEPLLINQKKQPSQVALYVVTAFPEDKVYRRKKPVLASDFPPGSSFYC